MESKNFQRGWQDGHGDEQGCAAGMLVMRCLKGMQLQHLTLTGRPEINLLGVIVCQRNDEEVLCATRMVARELGEKLVRVQRDRHEHEHGRHGHEALKRHSEENVVGIDATVLCERLGTVTMVAAWREAGKTSSATTAAYARCNLNVQRHYS